MIPKDIILSDSSLDKHLEAWKESMIWDNQDNYRNQVKKILSNLTLAKPISLTNKARILTTLLFNFDRDTLDYIYPFVDLPEMVKATEMLDANRAMRQLKRKLAKMSSNKSLNDKKKKVYERKVEELLVLNEANYDLSLTSSRCELIRQWTQGLTKDQLEYRALMFSTDHWKKLADLVHLNPTKDFAIDWFLPYCFGGEVPKDSIVCKANGLTINNFESIYSEFQLPYEFVRTKLDLKTGLFTDQKQLNRVKEVIAFRENVNTVLWYWNELECPAVNRILKSRLEEANDIRLSYGKLVELLMKITDSELNKQLVKIAENRLTKYKVNLPGPIAVLGDASSSMQVAVKTSSIVTSLLCALTDASLNLFRGEDEYFANPPKTIQEAINFAKEMIATGSTSPAASLAYYYIRKQIVKTFIIVTDEEENTATKICKNTETSYNLGYMFADLFKKYRSEVYSAKLIFISFTDQNLDGFMVRELKSKFGENNIKEFVEVYKFDVYNPDLNRLDSILEKMSK